MPGRRRASSRLLFLLAGAATVAVLAFLVPHWRVLLLSFRLSGDFSLDALRNAQGYAEFRHRQTGILMVLLPAGSYLMGEEEGRFDERPRHRVFLDSFLIAKQEVSQSVWERVMGSNPSGFPGAGRPVEMVSWNDCRDFCARTGLELPTEAQWEYACRAGTDTPYSTGERLTAKEARVNGAAFDEGSGTAPVGSFPPNGFGLHDLHGNVPEWCQDVYDSQFYQRPEASGPNPAGRDPPNGPRAIRGGGWRSRPEDCGSARRMSADPDNRLIVIGFRPAFRLPP